MRRNGVPAVTICLPSIGRTTTLNSTLTSLRAQTYPDYEVLVLDNASPAEGAAVLEGYVKSEPRARMLRSEERLSMFENFQRGLDQARGRYVAFFHDDDVYEPDFIAEHVAVLDAHRKAAVSGSNCLLIDEHGRITSDRALIAGSEVWSGWRYIETVFALGNNIFPMQSVVLRREAVPERFFSAADGPHFTDYFLLMRLAEEHDVGLISDRLLRMRMHPDQASRQMAPVESLQLRTRLFNEYCAELERRWPNRAAEIGGLRKGVAHARRSAAVWMWLFAEDSQDAAESRSALDRRGQDRWLRWAMTIADRTGLARLVRNGSVQRWLRSAAYSAVARGAR
ncbi:MAG TPA: glycosyltransferase family 2 protein [Candidatus Dormibacteraeota bacterium]